MVVPSTRPAAPPSAMRVVLPMLAVGAEVGLAEVGSGGGGSAGGLATGVDVLVEAVGVAPGVDLDGRGRLQHRQRERLVRGPERLGLRVHLGVLVEDRGELRLEDVGVRRLGGDLRLERVALVLQVLELGVEGVPLVDELLLRLGLGGGVEVVAGGVGQGGGLLAPLVTDAGDVERQDVAARRRRESGAPRRRGSGATWRRRG